MEVAGGTVSYSNTEAGETREVVAVAVGGGVANSGLMPPAGGVGRLREGDGLGGAGSALGGEGDDVEYGEAFAAFGRDEEGLEEVKVLKGDGGVFGKELGPVVAAGGGDGGSDDAEIVAGVVDAEVEESVAVVDGIFLIVDAGGDQGELAEGVCGVEEAGFAGGVGAGFEDEESVVAGGSYAEVEALVGLVEDDLVGGGGASRGCGGRGGRGAW